MEYRTKLTIDDPEVIKCLDALASRYRLTSFIKVAVEFYLGSDEGQRICKSLAGNGSNKRKARKVRSPIAETVVIQPVEAVVFAGSMRMESKEQAPALRTGLLSTDDVMSRILKKGDGK